MSVLSSFSSLLPGSSAAQQSTNVPERIESVDALRSMRPAYRRVIPGDWGRSLSELICPIELEDGSALLLCVSTHLRSDHADALERQLLRQRRTLHDPARVVAGPSVLAALRDAADSKGTQIQDITDENALRATFRDMVAWGLEHEASDLHVNLFEPYGGRARHEVRFTVRDRYIAPPVFQGISLRTLRQMLNVIWMDTKSGREPVFVADRDVQASLPLQVGSVPVVLRMGSMASDRGPAACFRIQRMDDELIMRYHKAGESPFATLGFLPRQVEQIERALRTKGGAVVVSGRPGHGKSTTLKVALTVLDDTEKILTIEDPVEYFIARAVQNSIARDLTAAGADDSFISKLRISKRMAMHCVLLGEIRDRETGKAFTDLATSGISTLTTVHAPDAPSIPARLASDFIGVSQDLLSSPETLKLLIHQTLVPKLCGCASPLSSLGDKGDDYAQRLRRLYGIDPAGVRVRKAAGCEKCRTNGDGSSFGYDGRTVVAEVIEPGMDEALLGFIKQGNTLKMRKHLRRMRRTPISDPDTLGKTAQEVAVYKLSVGQLDPRDVEQAFGEFAAVELYERTNREGTRRRRPRHRRKPRRGYGV